MVQLGTIGFWIWFNWVR